MISGREILHGIAQYVRDHEPWSIYHEPRSLDASAPGWLKTWQGDGIIVRLQNERLAEAVLRTGLPVVDVLGVVNNPSVPLVHVDNEKIGQVAAEHLLERGFRQVAFCGIRELNWSQQRHQSFAKAAAGCRCRVYRLPSRSRTDSSWETQQERLADWIRRLPKPIGLMACYDPAGQRILEACRRAGVSVPEEVAVVGVDNDETVCEVCDPPLSSVAANHARVGREAARLLDRMMHGHPAPRRPTYIEPTGVLARQSSDALAIGDADVAAALRFIRSRASEGITVAEVVEHVSVSHSTLKDRFRRLLGRSLHEEIVHTRIKLCKKLLVETELPIRQIALETGFRHQEYMGVVFREKVGKTPGTFRKETKR